MDSAESRAFSTSSRIVVYKDLPGWSQHHSVICQYHCEIGYTPIPISDRFPPKRPKLVLQWVIAILLRDKVGSFIFLPLPRIVIKFSY